MSSFSCPHLNSKNGFCLRIKTDCVPGRAGCVLSKKFAFAVPAEDRIRSLDLNKKRNLSAKKKSGK
jgi:hypothetical protein